MPRFRTPYNRIILDSDSETNVGLSETIPDMSRTVKQIMSDIAHGNGTLDMRPGWNDPNAENNIDDPDNPYVSEIIDIIDNVNLSENVKQRIKKYHESVANRQKSRVSNSSDSGDTNSATQEVAQPADV